MDAPLIWVHRWDKKHKNKIKLPNNELVSDSKSFLERIRLIKIWSSISSDLIDSIIFYLGLITYFPP